MKWLAALKRRVMLMIGRGVVRLINDSGGIQLLQITLLSGETRDNVERFQDYGFTSHPHPGAEHLAGFIGGNRAHGIVIKVDDRRYRLKALARGEVALYDDQGQKVHLKRNGIRVDSPHNIYLNTDGVLRLEGEGVEIHGRTYVQSDVAGKGERDTYQGGANWHKESYTEGANNTSNENGIDVPHIPSDHPEGP